MHHEDDADKQLGQRILTLAEVCGMTSLGKSTVYDLIRAKDFPAPLRLTLRKRGWMLREVETWLQERRAERDSASQS